MDEEEALQLQLHWPGVEGITRYVGELMGLVIIAWVLLQKSTERHGAGAVLDSLSVVAHFNKWCETAQIPARQRMRDNGRSLWTWLWWALGSKGRSMALEWGRAEHNRLEKEKQGAAAEEKANNNRLVDSNAGDAKMDGKPVYWGTQGEFRWRGYDRDGNLAPGDAEPGPMIAEEAVYMVVAQRKVVAGEPQVTTRIVVGNMRKSLMRWGYGPERQKRVMDGLGDAEGAAYLAAAVVSGRANTEGIVTAKDGSAWMENTSTVAAFTAIALGTELDDGLAGASRASRRYQLRQEFGQAKGGSCLECDASRDTDSGGHWYVCPVLAPSRLAAGAQPGRDLLGAGRCGSYPWGYGEGGGG
jgi:hypothetical protein